MKQKFSQKDFMMLSFEDSETKKIANIMSNDSCRGILHFLSNKESTESEIAKEMELPISTVHYNLKQLIDAGLVLSDEFHYSDKGREVNHYKLANKYILISPNKTRPFSWTKFRSIVPAIVIVAATAFVLNFYNLRMAAKSQYGEISRNAVESTADSAAQAPLAASIAAQNPYLWFFYGGLLALALYLAIAYVMKD